MINIKNFVTVLFLMLAFTVFSKADIAPNPDEILLTSDFIVETTEDLSDFRFFASFAGAIHEIEIKNRSKSVYSSPGGGARYSSATILAIPKENLKEYPEMLTSPYEAKGKVLSDLIQNKQIKGIIELGRHQFSAIRKKNEVKNWVSPTYRIEKENNSLKLVKLQDTSQINELNDYSKTNTILFIVLILGGLFITIVVVGIGIWLFRKG